MARACLAEWIIIFTVPILAWTFFPMLGNPFMIKQDLGAILSWACISLFVSGQTPFAFRNRQALGTTILCYLTALIVSSAGAGNRGLAAEHAVLQTGIILVFWTIRGAWVSASFEKNFVRAVVGSAAGIALLGIAQKLSGGSLSFGLQALGKMQVFSTLGNPNYVASCLIFALPLTGKIFQETRTLAGRFLTASLFLICFVALMLTGSKSGWIALACSICVWSFFKMKSKGARLSLGLILIVLLWIACYLGASTHTGRGRLLIWAEAIQIWLKRPMFGVGLGNFNIHQFEAQQTILAAPGWADRYGINASFVFDAHNEPLTILAEVGLAGCLAWLAMILFVLKKGYSRARVDSRSAFLLSGWVGQLVFSLWNAILFYAPLGFNFWILAAMLSAEPAPTRGSDSSQPSKNRIVLALVLIACTSWIILKSADRMAAGILEHQGDFLLETGPFDQSTDIFRQAAKLNPHEGYIQEKLALSLFFEGKLNGALEQLEKTWKLYGDVGIPYLEAEILARQNRFGEAIEIYESIAKAFPNHITPPFMRGQIYLKLGMREDAARELQRVVSMPIARQNLKLDKEKVLRQKELARRLIKDFGL